MMFVDTHAHLTAKEFDADRDDVVRRALDAGVERVVIPAVDLEDSRRAIELSSKYGSIHACVGVHPHEAAKAEPRAMEEIEELGVLPAVVAIGEIGLDYHYDFSPRDVQRGVFRDQVMLAQRLDRPIVVHTRESISETVGIIEECIAANPKWRKRVSGQPRARGVFHCFSGDLEMARRVIGLGFYVSFPGIVTFKNALVAHTVAASVSIDDILLETDSPYMTPVPHRGRRNEPAYIPLIAARIADLHHLTVDDIARQTTYNAYDLFGIGEPEPPDAA
jgi:TatD DNase family protein